MGRSKEKAGCAWLSRFADEARTLSGIDYRALAAALRQEIETERIPVGAQLPSQRELARRLAIGRTTVVYAYNVLRAESLVRSQQGAGTWVVHRPAPRRRPDRPLMPGLMRMTAPNAMETRVEALRGDGGGEWLPSFVAEWQASGSRGYRPLADALRAGIATERIRVGTQLPSQRELAHLLVVGRTSVVSAYNLLQGESLIRPRRGAGTWVVGRPQTGSAAEPSVVLRNWIGVFAGAGQ